MLKYRIPQIVTLTQCFYVEPCVRFFALTQGSAFLIFADIKKAISKYILK